MIKTTLGQLLVNEALPEDMRDYTRTFDKKTTSTILEKIARERPELYREIAHKLVRIGQSSAISNNFSFSLKDFQPTEYKKKRQRALQAQIQKFIDDPKLDNDTLKKKITSTLEASAGDTIGSVLDESLKTGNRLAELVKGGAKGKPPQFNLTVGLPTLFMDFKSRTIPVPIYNSVSEGFDPVEYWANSYGTRFGTLSTKMATQDAGYFGKRLALAMHRLVVSEHDCGTTNGIAVPGNDPENMGSVLQAPVAGLKVGTLLTPEHLKKIGDSKILVRSPITCQGQHGLCARCAGIRDTGKLPEVGDHIGISAAMAASEKISQGALSQKHFGGSAGAKKNYTLQEIERLFEMPKEQAQAAAVATADGYVKSVQPAATGHGVEIMVEDKPHWYANESTVNVKPGDYVEAGDVMTEGLPNHQQLAMYRGIGDARMEFMRNVQKMTGGNVSRRNAEVLSRGVINHVQVSDPDDVPDGQLFGDVIRYDDIVRDYKPRKGTEMTTMAKSFGRYLEQPALHYTVGTKINKRVLTDLKDNGISEIATHEAAPSFEPHVLRMYDQLRVDPDWMTRLLGYGLEDPFIKGVARGDISKAHSESFVPSLAKGTEFGKELKTKGIF